MLSVSVVSAVAWSVVYSYGIWGAIELAILMIVRDFLLVGFVIATILWFVLHVTDIYTAAEYILSGSSPTAYCSHRRHIPPRKTRRSNGHMPSTSTQTHSFPST